jgi:hypothetical protein
LRTFRLSVSRVVLWLASVTLRTTVSFLVRLCVTALASSAVTVKLSRALRLANPLSEARDSLGLPTTFGGTGSASVWNV